MQSAVTCEFLLHLLKLVSNDFSENHLLLRMCSFLLLYTCKPHLVLPFPSSIQLLDKLYICSALIRVTEKPQSLLIDVY